ncbi:class II aldolase/adducin family protein [Campylobacter jejuni]|nr:class II aldolase/adducin family protein [Campylobacter jejuni]
MEQTQADYFYENIRVTRDLTQKEIQKDYELNTGKVIVKALQDQEIMHTPAILVRSHGPFIFGKDALDSVHNAVVLEEIAKMNYITLKLNPNIKRLSQDILDRHYLRKHGKNAYYGQQN